jgi:hypothetical protein
MSRWHTPSESPSKNAKALLKGGMTMNNRKFFLSAMLVFLAVMGFPAGQVMAGWEGQPPDAGEKLIGPELWGVVMIDTAIPVVATLRVKKIEDCAVDIDLQKASLLSAPANPADALNFRLTPGSVFGLPTRCTPIITKVKNYKEDTGLISFDCQIKFVVPMDYPGAKCE